LPLAGITDQEWFWALVVGVVVLIVLMAWIERAIHAGIKSALPEHVKRLEEIGELTESVVKGMAAIDREQKAENRAGYRLSVVQTSFGTVIGAVAGFGSDWVTAGGLGRILIATGVGLALVAVGPPLTIALYNRFLRPPGQPPAGSGGGAQVKDKRVAFEGQVEEDLIAGNVGGGAGVGNGAGEVFVGDVHLNLAGLLHPDVAELRRRDRKAVDQCLRPGLGVCLKDMLFRGRLDLGEEAPLPVGHVLARFAAAVEEEIVGHGSHDICHDRRNFGAPLLA
jgi:hypothetical protein